MQKEELTKVFKFYSTISILKTSFFKYNCTKNNNFFDNIFQRRQNNI